MAKVKIKTPIIPVKKVLTTQNKDRESLKIKALIVIEEMKSTGLRQDYIAFKMDVLSSTLSRFMNEKESYITKSMVDKAQIFLKNYKDGTLSTSTNPVDKSALK